MTRPWLLIFYLLRRGSRVRGKFSISLVLVIVDPSYGGHDFGKRPRPIQAEIAADR